MSTRLSRQDNDNDNHHGDDDENNRRMMVVREQRRSSDDDEDEDEDNESSNDDNDDSDDDQDSEEEEMALARDHSYLASAHPLGVMETSHKTTMTTNVRELAILELNGVVLFPGMTIPIRLRNRSLIRYLGQQLEICRSSPQSQSSVVLGILTQESLTDRRERRRKQRERKRNHHDQNNNENENNDHEDHDWRIGTVATITYTHERGAQHQQRQHQQHHYRPEASSGIWEAYPESHELVFTAVGTHCFRLDPSQNLSTSPDPYYQYHQQQQQQQHFIAWVQEYHPKTLLPPSWTRQRKEYWTSGLLRQQQPQPQQTSSVVKQKRTTPRRIRTKDDDDDDDSSSIEEAKDEDEITTTTTAIMQQQQQQQKLRLDNLQLAWNLSKITPLPYFIYEKFSPWGLLERIRQSMLLYFSSSSSSQNDNDMDDYPFPTWLLSSSSSSTISSDDNHHYNRNNNNNKDPTRISFEWACHVPMEEGQRLDLLECPTTIERLQYLHHHVKDLLKKMRQSSLGAFLACQECATPLTRAQDIFVVGGAEAATSNYVNPNGYIHQITTLRQIQEDKVVLQGPPSTENSYFPGYSWTITYCRTCYSLLGWKFQRVTSHRRRRGQRTHENKKRRSNHHHNNHHHHDDDDDDASHATTSTSKEDHNRPSTFFGFMSSNVVHLQAS